MHMITLCPKYLQSFIISAQYFKTHCTYKKTGLTDGWKTLQLHCMRYKYASYYLKAKTLIHSNLNEIFLFINQSHRKSLSDSKTFNIHIDREWLHTYKSCNRRKYIHMHGMKKMIFSFGLGVGRYNETDTYL